MELLPAVCLCLLAWSGNTFVDGTGLRVVVKEEEDAILPCSLDSTDIRDKYFEWNKDRQEVFMYDNGHHSNEDRQASQDKQFRGRAFHFPEELQSGNASIVIRNTKRDDSGHYTCHFAKLQPQRKFDVELVVGACPEPNASPYNETEDGVLLLCKVQGANPQPEVEWQDSAGNLVPPKDLKVSAKGHSFDVTLLAAVTKTGYYYCVVTQKDICHTVQSRTFASVSGNHGLVITVVVLAAVIAILVLVLVIYIKKTRGPRPGTTPAAMPLNGQGMFN